MGTPRVQVYERAAAGGMENEHAYACATAAVFDQFDRALSGREGEPARRMTLDAIAVTCARLGCRGVDPLEWEPRHLRAELSDSLMVEAWLRMACGMTVQNSGPLYGRNCGRFQRPRAATLPVSERCGA